jgi:hypothetical protein
VIDKPEVIFDHWQQMLGMRSLRAVQMRTQVLDERLEETFRDWYPDFRTKPPEDEFQQAA